MAGSAAEAPIGPERATTKLAVHEIHRPSFDVLLDHVGALLREATRRNRLVELLLGRVDHCLNETVDGFPLVFCDVRERGSVVELLVQLILRQPEIGGRCVESPEPTRASAISVTAKAVKSPETTE